MHVNDNLYENHQTKMQEHVQTLPRRQKQFPQTAVAEDIFPQEDTAVSRTGVWVASWNEGIRGEASAHLSGSLRRPPPILYIGPLRGRSPRCVSRFAAQVLKEAESLNLGNQTPEITLMEGDDTMRQTHKDFIYWNYRTFCETMCVYFNLENHWKESDTEKWGDGL